MTYTRVLWYPRIRHLSTENYITVPVYDDCTRSTSVMRFSCVYHTVKTTRVIRHGIPYSTMITRNRELPSSTGACKSFVSLVCIA